jgi:hypothetical protein
MTNKIPSYLLWRVLAWCVLASAFGMAVYRAKTQTIAHDEALIYEWFLDGGVGHVLVYNPGNHVLFTLLAKPVVWTLGVSEFTLRAPSLVGAAIYLIAVYLLCRRLFGDGILLLLSVAMLSLNPQILDFMLAARGYILGFAFLFAAMYVLTGLADRGPFQPDDRQWRQGCAIASVFLAFSVAANFTNVVPVVSLALAFAAVALGGIPALLKFGDRTVRVFAQYFALPGIAVGFSILWPFLIQARLRQLEINMHRASDAVRNAFEASFLYRWTGDIYAPSLGAVLPSPGSWQARVSDLGVYLLFPLLLSYVAFGLILASRRPAESQGNQNAHCRIFGGAAIASIVFIVVLHVVAKIDYPFSRYCLFIIPLFTIGSLLIAREVYSRFPRSYLKGMGLLIAAIVVFDYALSLHTTYFRYNAYDVISLDLYQAIASDARARSLTTVRVGGTWWYEPEINFYRRRYHASWMMPYDVKDASSPWQTPNALQPADYDYFVFTPAGDPGLSGPHVRTIFRDSLREITIVAIEK